MFKEPEFFVSDDQPVHCPYCGQRTDWLADFSHTNSKMAIHLCDNHESEYLFIIEDENVNQ